MGKGVKGSKKGGKVEKERRSAQKEQALASKRAERAERKQHRKNKAKHSDDEDRRFAAQLREQGLRIVETAADGNCLFRALGDQLWGRERDHAALRKQLLEHEELASDTFKWFVEDDEPWDDYLCRLRRDAEWGGNLELVAAANVFACHVVVHQLAAPRLEIRADAPPGAAKRTLHLSYHGASHYNSVRAAGDGGGDAPRGLPHLDPPEAGKSSRGAPPPEEEAPAASWADAAAAAVGDAVGAAAAVGDAVGSLFADPPQDEPKAKTTRSGACPCGSGKRYKKCCRPADLARKRREKAGDAPEPDPPRLATELASISI